MHPGHSSLPEVPRGANDDEWLEVVGRLGLVVVSRDGRIRYRPVEKRLWVRHRIRGFVLTGKGSQSTDGSLAVLGKHWNRISELVDADVPGPWMYSVTDRGLRELELHDRDVVASSRLSSPALRSMIDAEACSMRQRAMSPMRAGDVVRCDLRRRRGASRSSSGRPSSSPPMMCSSSGSSIKSASSSTTTACLGTGCGESECLHEDQIVCRSGLCLNVER